MWLIQIQIVWKPTPQFVRESECFHPREDEDLTLYKIYKTSDVNSDSVSGAQVYIDRTPAENLLSHGDILEVRCLAFEERLRRTKAAAQAAAEASAPTLTTTTSHINEAPKFMHPDVKVQKERHYQDKTENISHEKSEAASVLPTRTTCQVAGKVSGAGAATPSDFMATISDRTSVYGIE